MSSDCVPSPSYSRVFTIGFALGGRSCKSEEAVRVERDGWSGVDMGTGSETVLTGYRDAVPIHNCSPASSHPSVEAHSSSGSNRVLTSSPHSVSEYPTRGGISSYDHGHAHDEHMEGRSDDHATSPAQEHSSAGRLARVKTRPGDGGGHPHDHGTEPATDADRGLVGIA